MCHYRRVGTKGASSFRQKRNAEKRYLYYPNTRHLSPALPRYRILGSRLLTHARLAFFLCFVIALEACKSPGSRV